MTTPPESQPPTSPSALSRYLLYTLSLPERAVRGTIGLAAGAAKESAQFLVPQAFQDSKTYEIVVRNSLDFLTETVGGVESAGEKKAGGDDEFLARKAVGNFVDLAGMATLHLSPMWILAIVSDVAYGGKTYVAELAAELKKQGLIDDASSINHVDDVLAAIQRASGNAASLFDTPPLSVEQLKASLDDTRTALGSADYRRILPEAELKAYWNEMKQIAAEEQVSLLGVSGALSMQALDKLNTVSQGTLTGVRVAGGLVNRHVVGHYADALKTMRERGFYETVKSSSVPYVAALWNNFAQDRETWTEEVVSGRALGKAYGKLRQWLPGGRAEKALSAEANPVEQPPEGAPEPPGQA